MITVDLTVRVCAKGYIEENIVSDASACEMFTHETSLEDKIKKFILSIHGLISADDIVVDVIDAKIVDIDNKKTKGKNT